MRTTGLQARLCRAVLTTTAALAFGAPVASAATYRDSILAGQPLLYYRLDEASGTLTAADASGRGNNGAYVGATDTRRVPGAITDGNPAVDRATITATLPAGTQEANVEFWARRADAPGPAERAYLSHGAGVPQAPTDGWVFYVSPADNAFHFVWESTSGMQDVALPNCAIPTGETWRYYVIRFSGVFVECYVNGTLAQRKNAADPFGNLEPWPGSAQTFTISVPATW